ncbi:MAG TPA: DUF1854 domain-containing protein [Pirellulales bacterium]|jgi:hypothetical protein|nr:DUF1854 domain-containing protein [Pirellulales bacterium]
MNNRFTTTDFELTHDAFGRAVLNTTDGARHVGVHPVRGFPISDPQRGIGLCTSEGTELVWLDDLAQLPADVRSAVEAELAQREFLPKIERIFWVSMETDPSEWDVQTDRGRTKFLLKGADDVRRLDRQRALITDAHGIRYLICDPASLDRYSRRIVERYL